MGNNDSKFNFPIYFDALKRYHSWENVIHFDTKRNYLTKLSHQMKKEQENRKLVT